MRTVIDWDTEPVAPKTVHICTTCTEVELPVGAGKVPVTHHGVKFELILNHNTVTVTGAGSVTSEITDGVLEISLAHPADPVSSLMSQLFANSRGGRIDLSSLGFEPVGVGGYPGGSRPGPFDGLGGI